MKKNFTLFLFVAFNFLGVQLVIAQTCTSGSSFSLNENDFPQTCVSTLANANDVDEAAATASALTPTTLATSATFNHDIDGDSVDDVMVTMTANCFTPNGTNSASYIASCLGPDGMLALHTATGGGCTGDDVDHNSNDPDGFGPMPDPDPLTTSGLLVNFDGGSDFGGATCNDEPCTNCYVFVEYVFINGFNTNVAGFNLDWSSLNGSTEGIEAMVGWVEGTDASGATPFNTSLIDPATLETYCNAQAQTLTPAQHLTSTATGGTLPAGVFAADNGQADGSGTTLSGTDCANASQGNGEPGSGSGPNSGGDALGTPTTGPGPAMSGGPNNGALGLDGDNIITEINYMYIVSNSNVPGGCRPADAPDRPNGTETLVNTNVNGSVSSADICFVAPCGFNGEITFIESCGVFDIQVTNVTATGDGTTFDIEYSVDNGTSWTPTSNTGNTPGAGPFIADVDLLADGSTTYLIRLVDSVDTSCNTETGPLTAPSGSNPFITSFPSN